jgi:hypothetical protein
MTPSSMRVVELRLSLMGAHPDQGSRWGTALGQLLVVLPGNVSPQVWSDDQVGLTAKFP